MRSSEEPEELNPTVRDFQPVFLDMAALGLWLGKTSRSLILWKVVVWCLLLGYMVIWGLQVSHQEKVVVNVRFVDDVLTLLAAFVVQVQLQKHSEGLAAVLKALGPRRLMGTMRTAVLVLAFVPWIAQASMTAAHLCSSTTTTSSFVIPVTCLRFILVRNHIWLGAVLTACLCLGVGSRLRHLNSAVFLDGLLSPRAIDGARQAYGLLCSMTSVLDNALGPVMFLWHAVFAADLVALVLEASSAALIPCCLIVANLVLLLVLWMFCSEACSRLRFEALETIDTLAYKLSEQPELSLSGALACAAAQHQDLGLTCWGVARLDRALSLVVLGGATAVSGCALYFRAAIQEAHERRQER